MAIIMMNRRTYKLGRLFLKMALAYKDQRAVKHLASLIILPAILLCACDPRTTDPPASMHKPRRLIVFAAASLTNAFTEISKGFEAANPGVTVTINFAGSQALRTQIEEGASADVFASANTKEMDALAADGFVTQGSPQFFLMNELIIILPSDNPAKIQKLEGLATPGIKLILAAEDVPVGNYARQSLDQMTGPFGTDFKSKVLRIVWDGAQKMRPLRGS